MLNEAADATDFANRYLLSASAPFKMNCNQKLLDLCLTNMDGLEMRRGDWAFEMNIPEKHYDWYMVFLASKECLRPETKICTPR